MRKRACVQLGEGGTDRSLFVGGWTQRFSAWGASDSLGNTSRKLKGLERKPLRGKLVGARIVFARKMELTVGLRLVSKGQEAC